MQRTVIKQRPFVEVKDELDRVLCPRPHAIKIDPLAPQCFGGDAPAPAPLCGRPYRFHPIDFSLSPSPLEA